MTTETEIKKDHPTKKQKRHRALLLLTIVFLLAGIGYGVYWFLVLRHHQTTDDAYVDGNQVQIMSQVSGNVISVHVEDTDLVNAGDTLVTLDKTDAEQAYERARTALANSVRQTHQMIVNNRQYLANIELKKTALSQAQQDLRRREVLGASQAIAKEDLQHARDAVTSAQAAMEVAVQQYNANQALILDTPLEKQPAVQQAATQLRDAWLALKRTTIISPVTGYVSRRSVQIGSQISTSTPLMVIVPSDQLWIDANFKETQLAKMSIGQEATVIADFYGSNVVYHGKVAGLDMGTGSAFSLLPSQNATGNWIKVVQRLPVRIELDANQVKKYPLRIGLSTTVTVDTTNYNGDVLAKTPRQNIAYQSHVLIPDLTEINQIIDDIILSNKGK